MDHQQESRKIVCEMLLAHYKRKSYLHHMVTGDEKWIYFENPKRNRSYVDPEPPSKSTASSNRFGPRISKAKRRKRVTRDMSTLKNSMLELAAKFDDNYNTGLIKSFMFGLNKTEIKTMTDILSRYKFRDSHARISKAKRRKRVTRDMSTLKNSMLELAAKFDDNYNTGLIKSFMFGLNKTEIKTMTDILSRYKFRDSHARISKAKRRKRVTRDMSTLKNSMLELAAKFDDNYNTGLIKSFMFGLNKTEIKTMTDILSRYKFRDSHAARGLLTTNLVILNHGQVTWMTPELAPLSPNYHTKPTGKRFNSQQI
ncbi:mariner Mos1 transposase [Trichonephila clavipes]|uniref:Mariner Mos1 transposase n=1 Tax=Trichonephila clavipes TaxID=2585209 RepID=A0A8X6RIY6_TRICX|nr:mariner Mos1 transposase [Trichonephila clavipes]